MDETEDSSHKDIPPSIAQSMVSEAVLEIQ